VWYFTHVLDDPGGACGCCCCCCCSRFTAIFSLYRDDLLTLAYAVGMGGLVATSVFIFDVSIQYVHDLPDIFAQVRRGAGSSVRPSLGHCGVWGVVLCLRYMSSVLAASGQDATLQLLCSIKQQQQQQ
jgi:hypothetical protein